MKKSSLKSPTFVLALSLATIILALPSCSSTRSMPVVQSSDTTSYVQRSATHDTIYLRDSVYVREVLKGDTFYITRVEYRDRWRTRLVHDTIRDTQIVEKVIENPPERYVPKFYKWCTGLLLGLLLVTGIVIALKWWCTRRL